MTCRHVYNYVGKDICPDCGRPTHEPDFKLQRTLRENYYKEGKHLPSVCPDCGGTIRMWWSI